MSDGLAAEKSALRQAMREAREGLDADAAGVADDRGCRAVAGAGRPSTGSKGA